MTKVFGLATLFLGLAIANSASAASTSVHVEIKRSTMSRQLALSAGVSVVHYTFIANLMQVGSKSGTNAYVQMLNSGGINASANLIDNCLMNARTATIILDLTMDSSGAYVDAPNTSVIDLAKKPTAIYCYESVP